MILASTSLLWPILLLIAGLVLLLLETFIPSAGLLSVLAAISIVAAIGTAFYYGGRSVGTAFLAGTGILIPILAILLVRWWPRTPIGRRILIQPEVSRHIPSPTLRELVGRSGVAVSTMLPSGAIRIDGRTYDAVSDGMPIDPQTPIEVIAVRANHLVVRPRSATDSRRHDDANSRALDSEIPDPFDEPLG